MGFTNRKLFMHLEELFSKWSALERKKSLREKPWEKLFYWSSSRAMEGQFISHLICVPALLFPLLNSPLLLVLLVWRTTSTAPSEHQHQGLMFLNGIFLMDFSLRHLEGDCFCHPTSLAALVLCCSQQIPWKSEEKLHVSTDGCRWFLLKALLTFTNHLFQCSWLRPRTNIFI